MHEIRLPAFKFAGHIQQSSFDDDYQLLTIRL